MLSSDTGATENYTLSLHDALPICYTIALRILSTNSLATDESNFPAGQPMPNPLRSEEHTSELQSRRELVCRLLLEKKKTTLRKMLAPGWTHNAYIPPSSPPRRMVP